MNFWTDTHAHIYLSDFDDDREAMVTRAGNSGVDRIFMPNIDHTSVDAMLEVEHQYPKMCRAMMGLHPCSVKKDFEKELAVVEQWLSKRGFAAIGEVGTDLYWDKTFWDQQQEALRVQIGWARKYDLPLVIHCRSSIDETIELLEPFADGKLRGIFHCFTGTSEQANRITAMNFHLGIGGVVTFRNGGLDKVLPEIDVERVVLETDSPYLAPVPYRGKRNEPSYIPLIAQKIAALKNITPEALQETSTREACRLFNDRINA